MIPARFGEVKPSKGFSGKIGVPGARVLGRMPPTRTEGGSHCSLPLQAAPSLMHLSVAQHELNLIDLAKVINHVVVVHHRNVSEAQGDPAAEGQLNLFF